MTEFLKIEIENNSNSNNLLSAYYLTETLYIYIVYTSHPSNDLQNSINILMSQRRTLKFTEII